MTTKERENISRYLSLVLRHKPEAAGLQLDEEGWADVTLLLEKMRLTIEGLQEVVALNDKKRFILSKDLSRIRANQGHSVAVDLNLVPVMPPDLLYHGTATRNVSSILEQGLQKMGRNHVHLSTSRETALTVGQRYGIPVICHVKAGEMHKDGHLFFISTNKVWLTDSVPVKYLTLADE